jgi:hypothetical protein
MFTRLASAALALVVYHLMLSPILACADTAVPERPYYSYAYGKRFAFIIKESDAFKLAWNANADHPPLSARAAIRIAQEQLKKVVPNADDWTFDCLQLVPWSNWDRSHWYYVGWFRARMRATKDQSRDLFTSDGQPRQLLIPVLMTGSTVQTDITEWHR